MAGDPQVDGGYGGEVTDSSGRLGDEDCPPGPGGTERTTADLVGACGADPLDGARLPDRSGKEGVGLVEGEGGTDSPCDPIAQDHQRDGAGHRVELHRH
jgi:hypothetical protein